MEDILVYESYLVNLKVYTYNCSLQSLEEQNLMLLSSGYSM